MRGWVHVVIDRPMHSRHPRHPEIVYPVNYGYIPSTRAGDGHEVDAYVLGPTEPVMETHGRIIAVIHRADDVEQKLVVATDECAYTAQEIADAVRFMEQFFTSRVEVVSSEPEGMSDLQIQSPRD